MQDGRRTDLRAFWIGTSRALSRQNTKALNLLFLNPMPPETKNLPRVRRLGTSKRLETGWEIVDLRSQGLEQFLREVSQVAIGGRHP